MGEPQPRAEGLSIHLPDEAATVALARCVAALVRPGDVIALTGELGSGKTSFARAFITALPRPDGSPADEPVPSPTFTLVQTYDRAPAPVWHFDLYRLSDPGEVDELGWDEALSEGVVVVEWPDRLGDRAPADRLDITFAYATSDDSRYAVLQGGAAWAGRLARLARDAPEALRR